MIKLVYFGVRTPDSSLKFKYLIEAVKKYQNVKVIAAVDCTTPLHFKTYMQKIRHVLGSLLDKMYDIYNPIYKGKEKFKCEKLFKIAKENRIRIIKPENYDINSKVFLDKLKRLNPDLVLLCGCSQIIKKEFINSYPNKIINFHPTILPRYAGFGAFIRPTICNDQEAGVTFHYVNEKIDGGNIVLQKKIKIEKDENQYSLKTKLSKLACECMSELVLNISSEKLQNIPQDLSKRYYYTPKDLEKLVLIDWNSSYEENLRRFKVLTYLYLPKKMWRITKFEKVGDIKSRSKDIGTVVSISMNGIKVIDREGMFLLKGFYHLPTFLSVCLAKFRGITVGVIL